MLKTAKPKVFLCAGQGTHYFQMGRELYEGNDRFHHWMNVLDQKVSGITGESIIAAIYNPARKRNELFNQTRITSPAIFMVSYSLAQTLMEAGIRPDLLMGASLGELVAACVAGVIDLDDCIETLVEQAAILESHCEAGGMLAIIAPVERYHQTDVFRENVTLASDSHPSSFVVSGTAEQLAQVIRYLKAENICFSSLPVSQAFHSPHIDPAKIPFLRFVERKRLYPPEIPIISCLTGGRVAEVQVGHFWDCIRGPMNIQSTLRGLEKNGPYVYIDLSASGTFANFAKYALPPDSFSEVYALINPFGSNRTVFGRDGVLTIEDHFPNMHVPRKPNAN